MRRIAACLLAAALAAPLPALAQDAKAPAAVQKEFDGFLAKFRAALKANDGAAVAALTKLPFMNETDYADAAKFRAKAYPLFFPAKQRACVQRSKAIYERDGDKNDTFMMFCGQAIFVFTKTPAGFLFTDLGAND